MQFEALRHLDPMEEPSLAEMVEKSIDILSRNPDNGYFLYVEGIVFFFTPPNCISSCIEISFN